MRHGPSWRGVLGNTPEPTVKAGTCNVRSLPGRLGAVSDMATNAGVNILCLQETKSSLWRVSIPLDSTFARKDGISCMVLWISMRRGSPAGELPLWRTGRWSCSIFLLLLLSPAASWRSKHTPVVGHQCLFPGQRRPAPLNQFLTEKIIDWVANTGEDYVILGDWNREQKQQPLCGMIAADAVNALDTDPSFKGGIGTHRLDLHGPRHRLQHFFDGGERLSADAVLGPCGPQPGGVYDIPLKGTRVIL